MFGSSGGSGTPVNTVAPYFTASTDNAIQGQTLAIGTGTWTNTPASYTYQWDGCTTHLGQPPTTNSCSPISGATSSTYTVTAGDVGHSLEVTVTAHNGASASSPVTSKPSAVAGASGVTSEAFCTNAPITCGFPDNTGDVNVGVPPGTTLTPVAQASLPSGDSWDGNTLTIGGTGTVQNLSISGSIYVDTSNVTIQDVSVQTCNPTGDSIVIPSGFTNVKILHSTLGGQNDSNCAVNFAVHQESTDAGLTVVVENNYAYNISGGFGGASGDVENNYFRTDQSFNQGGEQSHNEDIYASGGGDAGSKLLIQHNLLLNMDGETSAVFPDNHAFGVNVNTTVNDNIVAGGDYTIYGFNYSGITGGSGNSITNNRFSSLVFAAGASYSLTTGVDTSGSSGDLTPFTGNIWDGAPTQTVVANQGPLSNGSGACNNGYTCY